MGNWRFTSLYYNGKKAAEAKSTEYTFRSNGEQLIGDGEVLGHSDGVVTTEATFSAFVPIGPMGVPVIKAVINQEDVSVGALFNGKIYKIDGRFTEASIKSESKTGVTEGTFKFQGGKPKETG